MFTNMTIHLTKSIICREALTNDDVIPTIITTVKAATKNNNKRSGDCIIVNNAHNNAHMRESSMITPLHTYTSQHNTANILKKQSTEYVQSNFTFYPDANNVAYSNLAQKRMEKYFQDIQQQSLDDYDLHHNNNNLNDNSLDVKYSEACTPNSSKSKNNLHSDHSELLEEDDNAYANWDTNERLDTTDIDNIQHKVEYFVPEMPEVPRHIANNTTSYGECNMDYYTLYNQLLPGCYYDFTDLQLHILRIHSNIPLDVYMISCLELLKSIVQSNTSIGSYSDTIKWYNKTIKNISPICSNPKPYMEPEIPAEYSNRSKALKVLSSVLYGEDCPINMTPTSTCLPLPSGQKSTNVTKFDLKGVIYSLLLDKSLFSVDNCLIHDKYYCNPELYHNLPSEEKNFSDVHTGTWFLHAFRNINMRHSRDILCPIILFIDGTPIDSYSKHTLEPVMMTLGIFNSKTRQLPRAWRLLGYIEQDSNYVTCNEGINNDNQRKTIDQVSKRQDYHHILSFILKEVAKVEKSKGILYNFTTNIKDSNGMPITKLVRLRLTVMTVIGDALGLDKLCDRFTSYNSKVKYLCRDCNCPTNKLSDLNFKCSYTERSAIKNMKAHECKNRSYYKINNNAFDHIIFGSDQFGINGCSPPEILHQILLGVVKKLTRTFLRCCTENGLKYLDSIASQIAKDQARYLPRDAPNIEIFNEGFSSKTKLTGDEELSYLFILFLTFSQSCTIEEFVRIEQRGKQRTKKCKVNRRQSITQNTEQDKDSNEIIQPIISYPKPGGTVERATKWAKMFEHTLCLYYWLTSESIPAADVELDSDGICPADVAIDNYLTLYYELVNKKSGTDEDSIKIHQLRHIPHYIRRFGSLLNFDGRVGERNLKFLAKQPARTTNQRTRELSIQSALRYYESTTISLLHEIASLNGIYPSTARVHKDVHNLENTDTDNNHRLEIGWKYTIHFDAEGNFNYITWHTKSQKRRFLKEKFVNQIIKWLRNPSIGLKSTHIDCFAMLKIHTKYENKPLLFHANPDYYDKSRFDWCNIKWETHENESDELYPGRLLMFIDPTHMKFDNKEAIKKLGKYWAVTNNCGIVKQVSTRKKTKFEREEVYADKSNVIITKLQIEDEIRLVDCDAIDGEPFVLCDKRDSNFENNEYVLNLANLNEWGRLFMNSDIWCSDQR